MSLTDVKLTDSKVNIRARFKKVLGFIKISFGLYKNKFSTL